MKENFGFIFCRNEKMQEEEMRRMKMTLLMLSFLDWHSELEKDLKFTLAAP